MKKDILFLGIGQGGSNIAYEMQKKGSHLVISTQQ